jgi:manganese/zinc/iron transport system ATP- binding protein
VRPAHVCLIRAIREPFLNKSIPMPSISFPYAGRHEAAPVPGQPALAIHELSAGYDRQDVLVGVDLMAPVGALVALIGANGSGKSTLFKAVAGLLPVRQGDVRIYGQPVGACHHRVAYLPQRSEIDWRFPMNARRLAITGRYVHRGWLRTPQPSDWRIVDAVLARLKIDHLAQRQIGQLSGGQQQRVMLARALAQGADLLLLDEPLNAVDAETRQIVAMVLAEERAAGRTIIVSTHDLDSLESGYDGVVHLAEGKAQQSSHWAPAVRQPAAVSWGGSNR